MAIAFTQHLTRADQGNNANRGNNGNQGNNTNQGNNANQGGGQGNGGNGDASANRGTRTYARASSSTMRPLMPQFPPRQNDQNNVGPTEQEIQNMIMDDWRDSSLEL
ncbi:uncharacterized protein LOC131041767 [Cryptomeria japonica]|uniref:uncharacterized protein LOC131041767 n=1 Tax=Cryptomeria japonica TaxID=3369 RepID=UPI0027DA6D0F|nr:uncharacterized protein LOC131041767 [Cryptomeria japonica]